MRHQLTPRNENVIDLATSGPPGRRKLIEQLFARHAPAVRRFLRGRAVPREEAEDMVQELFTRLMGIPRVEERMTESRGSVRSYLLTMTNNLIADQRRRRKVRNTQAAAEQALEAWCADERTPERIVAAQLELEAILKVLMDLPLNWRVAFVLQRFRHLSYQDIALHMGVTVHQVQNYLRRALRRIHKARRKIESAGGRPC